MKSLGNELGTFRTEGSALINCAILAPLDFDKGLKLFNKGIIGRNYAEQRVFRFEIGKITGKQTKKVK